MLLQSVTLILLVIASTNAQNPPGVPPRQGHVPQQPPVQQQLSQEQFQRQQMNAQEGQVHGHGHGGAGGNKLKFQSEIHNAEHILEHLQNVIKTKPKEEMSEEELEFHYFKMHDYDNNNKLDGVEIGKALTHFHDDDKEDTDGVPKDIKKQKQYKTPQVPEDELEEMIDEIMKEDDLDNDGYVDYTEFMKGQKRRGEFGDGEKPYNPDSL